MKLTLAASVGHATQPTGPRVSTTCRAVKVKQYHARRGITRGQSPRTKAAESFVEQDETQSTEGNIYDFDLAESAAALVNALVARGVADKLWVSTSEPFVEVRHKNVTILIAKRDIMKSKSEDKLEASLKEAFSLPANMQVRITFKVQGNDAKSQFVKEYFKGQLSIAAIIFVDEL